jgi:acyl carrier protein
LSRALPQRCHGTATTGGCLRPEGRLQSGTKLVERLLNMSPEETEIFDKLAELLTPFNEKNVELKPETEIAVDLAIDSVSVMDFVMEVEDHFDIDIPLNVLSDTHTMTDLVGVVKARVKKGLIPLVQEDYDG